MTNADKIREMTDEELSHFMQNDCAKAKFYACKKFRINGCDDRVCEQCWLDWLKQEAPNESE